MIIKTQKVDTGGQGGFTLIELIVVMAVFLFVIGAAIGIFLSIVKSQKQVLAEQQLINQISYVEEYMSKALRMAKTEEINEDCLVDYSPGLDHSDYHYGYVYLLTRRDSVTGQYNGIKFLNQSNEDSFGSPACQEFYLDADGILKEIKTFFPYSEEDGQAVALTPTSIKINNIKFVTNGLRANGVSEQDVVQPRVTVSLNVSIPGDSQFVGTSCSVNGDCLAGGVCNATHKCEPTKTIQITVSQRNLNVNYGQRE